MSKKIGDKAIIYLGDGKIQVRNEQDKLFKRIKYNSIPNLLNKLEDLKEVLMEKGYQVKIAEESKEELKEKLINYLKLSSFTFGGDWVTYTRSRTEGSVKEDETSKKMCIYINGIKEASKIYEFPLDQVIGIRGEIYSDDEERYSFYKKKLPEIIEKVNSLEEKSFKLVEPPILAIRYKTEILYKDGDKTEVPTTFSFKLIEKVKWPKWRRREKIYTLCEITKDFYLVKDEILEKDIKRFSNILDVPLDEFKSFTQNVIKRRY